LKSLKKKPLGKLIAIFILPGMVVFAFSIIVPTFVAVWYSLNNWPSLTKPEWIGLANFRDLLADSLFWSSLWNNLKLALYTLIGQVGIGYLMAFLLTSRLVTSRDFLRTVMFFPVLISTVVLSFLWTLVYSNDYGMLNVVLRAVGLGAYANAWLSDPHLVVEALAVPLIWQWFGFYMVIFMGALGTIPKEITESAELDGAVGFKKAFFISIPLTYDAVVVAVLLCLSGIMKMFDTVLVMTDGGPGNSSMVLALYAYRVSFRNIQLGYGNTIAVGIVVVSLSITFLARALLGGKRYAR
jgi:raffinose/stachyose/melibiose transport system permease protein